MTVHELEETVPAPAGPAAPVERTLLLAKTWAARDIDPKSIVVGAKGTIMPRSRAPTSVIYSSESLPLPRVLGDETELGGPQFRVIGVLGEGGMGVVRSAEQVALAREVAIKTLRDDAGDDGVEAQLLREARVTGALEHPNIVPVHVLGRDERGKPIIVMKRIDGTSWAHELGARPYAADAEGLVRHLGILVQVARAVGFAHARGVLHRDLKPENVMIGEFGEIYLVDWGIAVALWPRAVRGLPTARDIDDVAGTPAYMAPEMAAADGERHGVRTDVYLLGSILYEILAGGPPHDGATIHDVLTAAFVSRPPRFAPEVPTALAAICKKAMSADPDERHASADAFRQDVEQFLLHRSSTVLSDAAESRLATLREAVRTQKQELAVRQAIYGTFSECRFAFGHALEVWPANEQARRGRQEALELMIDFELRHGSAGAAAAHLAELDAPAPELAARVAKAQRSELEGRDRLASMERDIDVTAGDTARAKVMFLTGLGWGGACFTAAVWNRSHAVTALEFDLLNLFPTVLTSASVLLFWRGIVFNQVNRRLWTAVAWSWVGYLLMWPCVHLSGMSMRHALGVAIYACTLLWGALTITLDRDMYPVPLVNVVMFVIALFFPGYEFLCAGVGATLGCGLTGLLWLRRNRARLEPAGGS